MASNGGSVDASVLELDKNNMTGLNLHLKDQGQTPGLYCVLC